MSAAEAPSPLIALVGNPNCGKTALFNRLTGARQKVANYSGVTIERKEGRCRTSDGRVWRVLDLPGMYGMSAATPDEAITRDVITGARQDETTPDGLVCVVDATNLRLGLKIVLDLAQLGLPTVLALNMMDVAERRKIHIDIPALQAALAFPVVRTVAVKLHGEKALLRILQSMQFTPFASAGSTQSYAPLSAESAQQRIREILERCVTYGGEQTHRWSERVDSVVLHPILGIALLAGLMFLVFQAVFAWAQWPMDAVKSIIDTASAFIQSTMPPGMLRDLLAQGVIGGAGSVLVFLPQILILFFFILALEDSGYLPRAAFLLDRMMGKVGLSGRAFIPLLSSFACAIPGIMATRTIQNHRDRLVTIMLAPLMTCSARLPVYALIIAAFIPQKKVWDWLNLQGIVLFLLYVFGILSAILVALALKKRGPGAGHQPLMLELPQYRWPHGLNLAIGLWERAKIFLTRVGTIILSLMIVLWFLSRFPSAPVGATQPAIYYSVAGMLGRALHVIFAPLGFNWEISIALVPGLAAREVAVGALGTVYAVSQTNATLAASLAPVIANSWSLPTALSLLVWYVFAPQCIATLGVVRRETNSWRYPAVMAGYLFALAYAASFVTFQLGRLLLGN